MDFAQELSSSVAAMGLDIDTRQQQLLLRYMSLLSKWNKVYNLTAIREPAEMLGHHLLDSLSVLPYLWPGRWLDVGCGAGLPGLVLAIARPDWQFVLLDSNSKKTSFVQQAIIDLQLTNVTVCCARVEAYRPPILFDGIVSRAFADLGLYVRLTRHLLNEGGRWAAMKGWAEKELDALPGDCRVEDMILLKVPRVEAARSLVIVACNGAK